MSNTNRDEFDKNERILNAALVEALDSGSGEALSKIASAATVTVRRRIREQSITQEILPFEEITNDDLNQQLDNDSLMVIYEMEGDQPNAVTIPFNDTSDQEMITASKFAVIFFQNATPNFTINVDKLRTWRANIREIVVDNANRDLARRKDFKFMAGVDGITGIVPGEKSPMSGEEQYVLYPGRLTRDNWVSCKNILPSRNLQNGKFVCNLRTFSDFERWTRDQMGGDFSEKVVREGLSGAFDRATFGGVPFVVTLSDDLIGNGILLQFAPSNYLGKAGVLMKPTMNLEKKKDILTFSVREKIGMTIANVAAVQKVAFQDTTGVYGGDGRLNNSGSPLEEDGVVGRD